MNKLEKLLSVLRAANQRVRQIKLHHFANGYPRTYFSTVVAAALVGYGFLLLFPLLGVVALSELFDVAQKSILDIYTLSHALIWFAILIFSIAMSHHIFTVRFELPKGVSLSADKTPRLFEIIENKKSRLFWPRFSSVLLCEQFELEIYKTPALGIPVWSKNTLLVGFALMQTLPQHYFTCALERKLIQFAKGRNIVTNWLSQLQYIWIQYPDAFSERKLLGEQLIVWFFKLYAPFYKKFSLYVAQREELAADRIALRHINDFDLFKSIESQAIGEYFFHKIYLPMLGKLVREKNAVAANLSPYTTLPKVYRTTVTAERCKQWLDMFLKNTVNTRTNMPTLSQRTQNIGHSRIRLPNLEGACAAESIFETHYPIAVRIMDSLWRTKVNRKIVVPPTNTKPVKHKTTPQNNTEQIVT